MGIARKIGKELDLAAKRVPRWMKGLGFSARRVWQASHADEVRFFDRRLKKRDRFFPGFDDPDRPLQQKYVRLLEPFGEKPVEILDVGSGPLTAVGRRWGAVPVRVVPVDALADAYNELLDTHGIEPPFPPVQCEGEQLEAKFGADVFDLVVANNSIDHCYDPLAVIENMVAVVKEGHCVFLRHKINEGSNRKFTGMHQWNFTEKGGDFVISDGKVTINVSREFADRAHTDAKRDGAFLEVTMTKKSAVPFRGTQGGGGDHLGFPRMNPSEDALMPDIQSLLSTEEREAHDFSGAPSLVRRRTPYPSLGGMLRPLEDAAWSRYQRRFMRWVAKKKRFDRKAALAARQRHGAFFERTALLEGNVLDVGGANGLYRRWWAGGDSVLYVVHEPVPERPAVANAELREFYESASRVPFVVVEGVGEFLPYRDRVFDTAVIKSVLDHVKSPQRVLEEVYRCLRPGGRLVLVQQCEGKQRATGLNDLRFESAAWRNRIEPIRLVRIYWDLVFHKGHHIWHFTRMGLREGLSAVGYGEISVSVLDEEKNYVVVEAWR